MKCLKCGHEWSLRGVKSSKCPSCHIKRWYESREDESRFMIGKGV